MQIFITLIAPKLEKAGVCMFYSHSHCVTASKQQQFQVGLEIKIQILS